VATARKEKDGNTTLLVGVTSGKKARHEAFYARFLELGTSSIPAQPFLGPALDASADEAVAMCGTTIGQFIDHHARRKK
jgi:HK97 gp10 family phage protein